MPPTATILPNRERALTPWPNGNGSSMQVAISPSDAAIETFDWRVSIAIIDSESPFSQLAGVSRWLMPLSPNGMTLRVEGERTRLASREAFAFNGESTVRAIEVRESSLDLNLMVRRGKGDGSLLALVADGDTAIAAGDDEAVVVVILEGNPLVQNESLEPLDAIKLDPGCDVVLHGDAILAIARITRGRAR